MASAESASSSFSYSDFRPVKARKGRKNRHPRAGPPLSAVLESLREQLRHEEWFAQCSQIIDSAWREFSAHTPAVLCLGLGSPSTSPVARIQLAFLAETCQQLHVAPDAVAVYDPVFTADDGALLAALRMRAVPPPGPATLALAAPTLCFMPHCDIELYDALLRPNWSAAALANVFIVGNALQEYIDNKPLSTLQARVPCLLRAAPLLARRALPPARAWPTAFNNTAVQFRAPRPSPSRTAGDVDADSACAREHRRTDDDNDEELFAAPPWDEPRADAAADEDEDAGAGAGPAPAPAPAPAPTAAPAPAPVSIPAPAPATPATAPEAPAAPPATHTDADTGAAKHSGKEPGTGADADADVDADVTSIVPQTQTYTT